MKNVCENFANDFIKCFDSGHKILIVGNGGSAAEAQHLAAELVGHFEKKRKALPAIALTTDTSALTAISNDDSFEDVFARQVEALGQEGDILVILSTSGKSQNCIEAETAARDQKMIVRQFPVKNKESTALCQEKHLKLIHNICRYLDSYYE